jgi:acetyl-CoA carboxylase carboxyltransferase component
MGPEGAVNIIFRRDIQEAAEPEHMRDEKALEYRQKFANPYIAASLGYIDEVIDPKETRARLSRALDMLQNKRDSNPPKKHGNIPL